MLSNEYIDNRHPLTFQCSCGEIFQKNWSTIQRRGQCKCRSCARKNGWTNKRRSKDFSETVCNEYKALGFEPLEDIHSKREKVLCKDVQGYKGYINYQNAIEGKHFSIFSITFNKENLLYNLNNFVKNNNLGTVVNSFQKYGKSGQTKLYCTCSCGTDFVANLSDFTTQNHCRCAKCSKKQSGLEYLTEIEVMKYTQNYSMEKRFDGCRNPKTGYPLPFDFYIKDINTCIEIDGEQHYYPSKFGNESDAEAEINFKKRQFLDKIKNEYCGKENINLVRISYKEFRNKDKTYKQIIKSLFN